MDKEELVAQIQAEIDRATKNCEKCVHIDVCRYYPREQCEYRNVTEAPRC